MQDTDDVVQIPEVDSITVMISDDALEALREIARLKGVSPTEALKVALADEWLILREAKNGARILIKNAEGVREVKPLPALV